MLFRSHGPRVGDQQGVAIFREHLREHLKLLPAHLAELVDALGLGSSGFGRGGSSPPVGIDSDQGPSGRGLATLG